MTKFVAPEGLRTNATVPDGDVKVADGKVLFRPHGVDSEWMEDMPPHVVPLNFFGLGVTGVPAEVVEEAGASDQLEISVDADPNVPVSDPGGDAVDPNAPVVDGGTDPDAQP